MALFSKADPFKSLRNDLDTARATCAKLRDRLAQAEGAIAAAAGASHALALSGANDSELDAAEAKQRACTDRQATLRTALAQAEVRVADLDTALAVALDKITRDATITEVAGMQDEIKAAGLGLVAAIDRLALVTAAAGAFISESGGLHSFCLTTASQIPPAISLVHRLLGEHGASVARGDVRAALPKPEGAYVPPTQVLPGLSQVFILHAVTWVDHHGQQRRLAKWRDIEVSPEQAARALRKGWACTPDDPRCKKLRGQSMGHPEPHWCKDLDSETDNEPDVDGDGVIIEREPTQTVTPFIRQDRTEPFVIRHKEGRL